jgi:hypothetical protein
MFFLIVKQQIRVLCVCVNRDLLKCETHENENKPFRADKICRCFHLWINILNLNSTNVEQKSAVDK